MKHKLNWLFSFLVFGFFGLARLAQPALAVDLTVDCDGTDCTMSPTSGAALFQETNWLPGDTITRTITVDNSENPDDCDLVMDIVQDPPLGPPTQTPADFATKLFTAIRDGLTNLYGVHDGVDRATNAKTLNDLYTGEMVTFGLVPAGNTKVFDWTVTFDFLADNAYQNAETEFDFAMHFECGEREEPELAIDKTNDHKNGPPLGLHEVVTFTVSVENTGLGVASNVEVIDTQPIGDYFDYRKNSGRLTCIPDGPTNAPITASGSNPYTWLLGDMDPDKVCTLTYELEIISTAIPGTHHNLAFARGLNSEEETIFSNAVIDPFDIGVTGEVSGGFKPGQVLGAAVGQVLGAATGSKTFWLALALAMIAGSFFLSRVRKSTLKSLAVFALPWLVVGLSLISAPPVMAADTEPPLVKIVQLPSSMDTRDFEISYTALDGGEAGLASVHLEFKKDGGSWQDLGAFSEVANKVSLNGKITDDGKYFFRATACDNNANCATSETSTNVDSGRPPPPQDFKREKTGGNTYKITWHNPDDDDLAWVYIYRSDQSEFTADDGTKIASVAVTKNTNSEYIDTVPDSSKTYYYALRAIDSAGNASDLVGGSVTIAQAAPAGTVVTGEAGLPGQVPTAVGGEGAGGAAGGEAGSILGVEEPEATPSASPSTILEASPTPSALGDTLAKLAWYHWLALLAGGSFLIFLLRFFIIKGSDR